MLRPLGWLERWGWGLGWGGGGVGGKQGGERRRSSPPDTFFGNNSEGSAATLGLALTPELPLGQPRELRDGIL